MTISNYIHDNAELGKMQEGCYNEFTKAKDKSLFGLGRDSVHGHYTRQLASDSGQILFIWLCLRNEEKEERRVIMENNH